MLVLTRKIREELLIFPDGIDGRIIRVSLSEIRYKRVSVMVDAPKEILILKGETYQKYLEDKESRESKEKAQ